MAKIKQATNKKQHVELSGHSVANILGYRPKEQNVLPGFMWMFVDVNICFGQG